MIAREKEIKSVLDKGLRYARRRVEYADVLFERITKIELQQLPDRVITKPFALKSRVQLRLLDKGKVAEIKVGVLTAEALKSAVDIGLKLLKSSPKPEKPVRLAPIPNPGKRRYGLPVSRQLDAGKVFAALDSGVKTLARGIERKYKPQGVEVSPEVWFYHEIEEKAIADSKGIFKTQVLPRTFLQILTRVKDKDGRMSQTRARLGDVKGIELLLRKAPKGYRLNRATIVFLTDWFTKTVMLLNAGSLSAEEVKQLDYLILHATALGVFVHEALGHNFEADGIKSGTSGIVDKDGKARGRVAADIVHIMDGPLDDRYDHGFGTHLIDDEGVEVKTKMLAERGEVREFILNRETAAFFGREPNGGAFSALGDPRIPRMTNTYILPADRQVWRKDLKALIADVKKGIILVGTMGGAVTKDGMSSSVQLGYLVEDGKIGPMIKAANFAAKTLHALHYVDAFAGKMDIDDVGFCGKDGQHKPVGDGGPEWTRLRNNEYVSLMVQG
jgi:predicted Zn-dependent protease